MKNNKSKVTMAGVTSMLLLASMTNNVYAKTAEPTVEISSSETIEENVDAEEKDTEEAVKKEEDEKNTGGGGTSEQVIDDGIEETTEIKKAEETKSEVETEEIVSEVKSETETKETVAEKAELETEKAEEVKISTEENVVSESKPETETKETVAEKVESETEKVEETKSEVETEEIASESKSETETKETVAEKTETEIEIKETAQNPDSTLKMETREKSCTSGMCGLTPPEEKPEEKEVKDTADEVTLNLRKYIDGGYARYITYIYKGGSVNVTPKEAVKNEDGSVTYNFEVSLQPTLSDESNEGYPNYSARTFIFTMPKFVENVKFKLIGTEDKNGRPVDVDFDLNTAKDEAYFNNIKDIPTAEEAAELKKAGVKSLDGIVLEYTNGIAITNKNSETKVLDGGNYSYEYEYEKDKDGKVIMEDGIPKHKFDENDNYVTLLKQYGLAVSGNRVVGINVNYSISKEQFEKTPYMPLDVRSRGLFTDDKTEKGVQLGSAESDLWDAWHNPNDPSDERYTYHYIEHPEKIEVGDFDEHGLYSSSVSVTKNTGHWHNIGPDRTKSIHFAKIISQNINIKNNCTFYASFREDSADVAVSYIPDTFVNVNGCPKADKKYFENEESYFEYRAKVGNPYYHGFENEGEGTTSYSSRYNLISNGGAVNVTPICAVRQKDGSVEYEYEISLGKMTSSSHLQTIKTFAISIPKFIKDVEFKLIGTWDKDGNPQDIDLPLGVSTWDEYWELRKNNGEINVPSYERYQKMTPEEKKGLDGVILEYMSSEHTGAAVEKVLDENGNVKTVLDKDGNKIGDELPIRRFGLAFSDDDSDGFNTRIPIIGLRLKLKIDAEQYKKTPYIPVDARAMWLSEEEKGGVDSMENGSKPLEEYRQRHFRYGNSDSYYYIENPEEIKRGDFDVNGLYTGSVVVTKNMSHWSKIGRDLEYRRPKTIIDDGYMDAFLDFDCPGMFYLGANPGTTYITSRNEDYGDIAVGYICDDLCPDPEVPEKPDEPETPPETPDEPEKPDKPDHEHHREERPKTPPTPEEKKENPPVKEVEEAKKEKEEEPEVKTEIETKVEVETEVETEKVPMHITKPIPKTGFAIEKIYEGLVGIISVLGIGYKKRRK